MPAAAPSLQVVPQHRAEYGHFNEARLLAIQAHAGGEGDIVRSNEPAPAPSQPSGTHANAQPVVPRAIQREIATGGPETVAKTVDQRSKDVGNKAVVHTGQKRKGTDSTAIYVLPSKKKKAISTVINVPPGTTMTMDRFGNVSMQPNANSAPAKHKGYSCIRCVNEELSDCDGQAHCNNCTGFKCKYVLCELPDCRNKTCVKIHPFQYDLDARKPGETRMVVVYDNIAENLLTSSEKLHLKAAIARMEALRTKGNANPGQNAPTNTLQLGAPVPGTKSWQAHKVQAMKEQKDRQARTNNLQTRGPAPDTNIWQAHKVQVKREDSNEEFPTNTLPTTSGANVQQWRPAQPVNQSTDQRTQTNATQTGGPLPGTSMAPAFGNEILQARPAQSERQSTHFERQSAALQAKVKTWPTGTPVFGSNAWQANGVRVEGNGVGRAEPDSHTGLLVSKNTNPFQADPFRIPQAVRNAAFKAQMSAASDAIGPKIGNSIRKDSFWSGDPHNKANKHDGGETL